MQEFLVYKKNKLEISGISTGLWNGTTKMTSVSLTHTQWFYLRKINLHLDAMETYDSKKVIK